MIKSQKVVTTKSAEKGPQKMLASKRFFQKSGPGNILAESSDYVQRAAKEIT